MASRDADQAAADIESICLEATRLLVEAAHPERIMLFGSYARGDFTPDSDLDLLVILPEVDDRIAEMVRLRDALSPLHFPADVMVATTREVTEQGHLPGSALRWALEEGKILYASILSPHYCGTHRRRRRWVSIGSAHGAWLGS